jgi:hypothetical protein
MLIRDLRLLALNREITRVRYLVDSLLEQVEEFEGYLSGFRQNATYAEVQQVQQMIGGWQGSIQDHAKRIAALELERDSL